MLKRSGPIKRKAKKSRTHNGRTRLGAKDMKALREAVYDRAQGLCEMPRGRKRCGRWAGWLSGEMHHIRHKSLGGSDVLENCAWSCPECHRDHHCPKAVKVKRIVND